MAELEHWEERYRKGETPWDTGHPSTELQRVIREEKIRPCRAIELGCGTGNNAVWLAQQGFDVTAVDLSSLAAGIPGGLSPPLAGALGPALKNSRQRTRPFHP